MHAIIPRRSRLNGKPTTGILAFTQNDARGFMEPLSRYGHLPTNHLIEFDTRYRHTREKRLSDIYQETIDWKLKDKPIIRFTDAMRFSINVQAQYKLGPAYTKYLRLPDEVHDWVEKTKIGPYFDDHDVGLALAVSEIELAVKKAGLRFINHFEILQKASPAAQAADKPLEIPIPKGIRWNMRLGFREDAKTAVAPDAMFGIEYPGGRRWFAVEYDRGTETELPKGDLKRRSWLRKVLCYQAISKGPLKEWLDIDKLYVLAIIPSEERLRNILGVVKHVYSSGTDMFAMTQPKPVGAFTLIPPPDDFLFQADWLRVGHPPLSLTRP